jgi:26S proteasome non-ATPase regulatory subunit 9
LKSITKTIDEGIEKYFMNKMDVPGPSSSKMPRLENLSIEELKPFLVVTLVDRDSPGDIANVQIHDMILKFGSITQKNFTNLAQIGELVKNSQNQQINVKIRRNGTEEDLIIIPKVWHGQGLLGFKINAIPSN